MARTLRRMRALYFLVFAAFSDGNPKSIGCECLGTMAPGSRMNWANRFGATRRGESFSRSRDPNSSSDRGCRSSRPRIESVSAHLVSRIVGASIA